jgi:hypothetical protein
MRTTALLAGVVLSLALMSNAAYAQTPNTGSGGDVIASDGGAGARWWNKKGEQYPKCEGPAKQGATLTGEIQAEAYKEPENIEEVNKLGKQREEVKHELLQCIAENYGGVTLQGSAEVKGQGDPEDPYSGGTSGTGAGGNGKPTAGKGGSGKPGTGKTAPPAKKTPPLSGGTNKSGGPNTLPGYPYPLPPQTGGGNAGPHNTPPVWVGTAKVTWVQPGLLPGSTVPQRVTVEDTIELQIWDMKDPHVYLNNNGSLFSVVGRYNNGTFAISQPVWRNPRIQRSNLNLHQTVRLRHP